MSEAAPSRVERLVAYYERAARNMQGLPMYNAALAVEAVGFREHDGRLVGVIVTPWFMNLTLLPSPADLQAWRKGSNARVPFPSGQYDFAVGDAGENDLIATCSLFSLMHDFIDHEAARATALAAAEALFEPPAPPPAAQRAASPAMSRRRFLRGG
ncbi:MAG TPA: [NiFe]-hydrogenase assembly chaperone HybE [Steroidobacteraceae bacterium]|nr:[NiFe]-hydrogenase assembly chaperone HybE [Steroidobacteraceae bacterium]